MMDFFQNLIKKLLKIIPARDKELTVRQAYTFQQNILRNKIWYYGEPSELEQFFKKTSNDKSDNLRFWAAVPNGKVRKIHLGIVSMVIDRYRDIVMSDINGIDFGEEGENTPLLDLWNEIAEDNDFASVMGDAVQKALMLGDGAFKISTDEISEYPIIEFYEMDNVEYKYRYGRLIEIKFYTDYISDNKSYRLQETYGKGYIKYKLYDEDGKEKKLSTLEETQDLTDSEFDGDFIMGIPFKIFSSAKWKGRGKALFDTKSDVLDALDEVISQWVDAIRLGRIKRYIPEDLIPRNAETGELEMPNPFDNDYLALSGNMKEDSSSKVDVSQPQIAYEAFVNSYICFMDMVLQGIISPATLGIDLKKTDNADSQREKEKITIYVRSKIVEAMTKTIPLVVNTVMQVYDLMELHNPGEYESVIKFGEYASPDFDSTVDTVSKARGATIMSIDKAIEELYGDSISEDEKKEEIKRLKEELGIADVEEMSVSDDLEDEDLEDDEPDEEENTE